MAQITDLKLRRKLWTCERGAELVEFAFVFPTLLLVMLGIIDFGFLFQRYEVVTNAAREGARVAILPGYADADVQARVTQYLTAGGLTGTATTTVGAPQAIDQTHLFGRSFSR
jgi:Flp pilus assembly protein TadG